MKELSIEAKAKAYDEALEVARKYWDSPRTCIDINVLPKLFSELKELEDERIRKELISHFKETIDNIRSEEIIPRNAKILVGKMQKWIIWLEKQGEQKPTDKVEPKFKVDDWITDNNSTFQIVRVENEWYYADDGDKICFDVAHQYYHLWTIQDSKDGDVLANDHHILILRELGYSWAADGNPDSLYAYCGIKPNGNFELEQKGYCFCGLLHTYPATKKQRNLLFQKMCEAGYAWDDRQLKIIKIGQKPAEWSEEDESCINQLIIFCENCMVQDSNAKKCADWLKSLKERVQSQNTWKPSDEQMEALRECIPENVKELSKWEMVLDSLYNDLKKLREE